MESHRLFGGVPVESEVNDMDARISPVVYICSKFRGDVAANTENARRYSRYALERGCIPIAPHLLFPQFMDEEKERDMAIAIDLVILTKCCQEMWVFGDEVSEGMAVEIACAEEMDMKVRFVKEGQICTKSGKD